MRPISSLLSVCRAGILIAALGGCGGAYSAAIARGDQFAAAGLWDQAAAAYAEAQGLDPTEPEAGIKLEQARKRQSGERLLAAKGLMARGEIEKGLVIVQEAAELDPKSTAAQAALVDANAEAASQAEEMLRNGDGQKALALITLVLKGSPRDRRARRVDARIREELADAAYARADAFDKRGRLGNALMEFASALVYVADFQDTRLRIGKIKLALEQELMFHVVLQRFAGAGSAASMSDVLTVDLLSQSFDPKLPLRVVDKLPPGRESSRGVELMGKFENYEFKQDKESVSRTCDYKCGEDRSPNPDYDRLEKDLGPRERYLSEAENKVSEKRQDVDKQQKTVDDHQKEVDRRQLELEKKRDELDKCRADRKPQDSPSKCSGQESNVSVAQNDLDGEKRRLESPKSFYDMARRSYEDAQQERDRARREVDSVKERLRNTPRELVVDRMCPYNWTSAKHSEDAKITVWITAAQLQDKVKLLDNQAFPFHLRAEDETFPPQPGRCSQASAGDPLKLPTETEMKSELARQVILGVREKVLASYDRYRQRFLADARREEAAGVPEEAVEGYVRYLLSGPKSLDPENQKQISDFLQRTRGFGKIDALPGL